MGIYGSVLRNVERGLRVKVFKVSRSISDLQSNSDNSKIFLEEGSCSLMDLMEPAALTPLSEYRLPQYFLGSSQSYLWPSTVI